MCGITGIYKTQGVAEVDRALLDKMNEVQMHRGPDEGGVHYEPGIGLAHRRLSIIDLATGQQPLFNEDKSVVVVFNGEIYNFKELAEILKMAGHTFGTHCDTEVIVHAWEEWGERCVDRFRGMFAFAIWDRNRRTLFMARDRLGIKPLYYAWLPDGDLIFASELKSILVDPRLQRDVDPCAVEEYFALGYVPEPRTILKQAFKLPPGHTLTVRKGQKRTEPQEYWDVPFNALPASTEQDVMDELIAQVRDAVGVRMIADVPLGAFLSGGVDSSVIVATMSEISNEAVNTCSISFGDPEYNESRYAQVVSEQYKTHHSVEQVDTDDFNLIDKLAGMYDEPYADSSAMPTYRVCELARRKVTVALSGDGGDENFAGYRRHRMHMAEENIRRAVPDLIRKPLFGLLGRIYPKLDWAPRFLRARSTFQGIAMSSAEAYMHSVSIMYGDLRNRLYSDSFHNELQGYSAVEVFKRHAQNAPTEHPQSLIQYLDMKTYLVGDILTKVDRASMAHSLEVRVPLLDHKLVEWVSGLDPGLKLRGGQGKYIFKKAYETRLSDEILYRPKQGFSVPIGAWLKGPLRKRAREVILGERLLDTGIFANHYLERLVDEHQSGRREHSAALWSLMMFESSLRVSLDS